jgi:hypothetical protein
VASVTALIIGLSIFQPFHNSGTSRCTSETATKDALSVLAVPAVGSREIRAK